MPFYDNYFSRSDSISSIGKWIIAREVQNRIRLSQKLNPQTTPKTLEFGPGKGHFARAVLSLGWEYLAIDGSPSVLKLLRSDSIEVIQSFVPPMPKEAGGGYDLVLMEHFDGRLVKLRIPANHPATDRVRSLGLHEDLRNEVQVA